MRTFKTYSPIDNSLYCEHEIADDSNIEKVLENARLAQRQWKNTTIDERKELCTKALDYFIANAELIGEEISWQMGRPIRYAPFEIKKGFKERAEYMISIAEQNLCDVRVPEINGFDRYIKREPLGCVFVLAPWNYPYLTSVNAIIPALMAGNTVVLKHAMQTPLCAERYVKAFEFAGLPAGVFQVLHLEHEQVGEIINDSRIDYVAFTGSVNGGKEVQKAMNSRFINAGMELGGKDPAYVRIDANLDDAIENLVDGSFFNSGQSCCGIERIYVNETLYKDFVDGFVALTKQYNLGNPLDHAVTLGPMVRASAAKYAGNQIKQATEMGAKKLIDPKIFPNSNPESAYMAPQVLINVNHNMDLMKSESFAPVVGIMPVKNDQEAIKLMNDSEFGLTASVWTKDIDQAKVIGGQIETGTFFMNRCDYLDPALAWTGVKNSGRGVSLSSLAYEVLTKPKSFHLKY